MGDFDKRKSYLALKGAFIMVFRATFCYRGEVLEESSEGNDEESGSPKPVPVQGLTRRCANLFKPGVMPAS